MLDHNLTVLNRDLTQFNIIQLCYNIVIQDKVITQIALLGRTYIYMEHT